MHVLWLMQWLAREGASGFEPVWQTQSRTESDSESEATVPAVVRIAQCGREVHQMSLKAGTSLYSHPSPFPIRNRSEMLCLHDRAERPCMLGRQWAARPRELCLKSFKFQS